MSSEKELEKPDKAKSDSDTGGDSSFEIEGEEAYQGPHIIT